MPNFEDVDHPDYECPRCFNNAVPCGCIRPSRLTLVPTDDSPQSPPIEFSEKEINKVVRRAARGSFESKFKATSGDLTYTKLKDGTIRFQRWNKIDDDLIAVSFSDEEQTLAEEMLAPRAAKAA